ncbi:hypothetical protein [Solidesulfovibrio magneticus]|uniref:Uncharacterized protein n=1 Tax=Solidesulfovibrio magneticus (strain ATCC 700980 / DSM 13731 / RS-1) TaxID=573370 RepID=C4XPR5_SOLM1|nr:hypothetical protein [Solidesulfovibrio magneticus]BAH77615.1 hypothetical protein DMR_41240 [Solidesulfovibrio magneticus RS-1]
MMDATQAVAARPAAGAATAPMGQNARETLMDATQAAFAGG